MPGTRERGETIRRFILDNVDRHPGDIAAFTAERFGISRQAAHAHIRRLVAAQAIEKSGSAKNVRYRALPGVDETFTCPLMGLEEDRVWHEKVRPFLADLPENVRRIWYYGVTEMLNNAIDHSDGTKVSVGIRRYSSHTEVVIKDDGIGIFKRLRDSLGLLDEHHAVLELSKGKVTTDPERHTGQGIFFSSRIFDEFFILSGSVVFTHDHARHEDWILERASQKEGTLVMMKLANESSKILKDIFDVYAGPDAEFSFNKTVVPVALAQYGDENLISRSQAKRLLARIDAFSTVILDFTGVAEIGQAFADEVFRVFVNQHPGIQIIPTNASDDVRKMIAWASAPR